MIKDQIIEGMKEAMRAHDGVRLDALRYVLSLMKNAEIDKHGELTDEEVIRIIRSEVKKRDEAIEQFKQGGRQDLVDQEQAKVAVLKVLLPAAMSEAEIEKLVDKVKAGGVSDFGGVMKAVMERVAGKAEGGIVAGIVKRKLG